MEQHATVATERPIPTSEEIMAALDDPQALQNLLTSCGYSMAEFVAHTEEVRSELEKAKTRLCVV